jgi:hypothetical protein
MFGACCENWDVVGSLIHDVDLSSELDHLMMGSRQGKTKVIVVASG